MNKNIREFCMTIAWISHNKLNKNLKNTYFKKKEKTEMKKE